jgi:hypothetical protein
MITREKEVGNLSMTKWKKEIFHLSVPNTPLNTDASKSGPAVSARLRQNLSLKSETLSAVS